MRPSDEDASDKVGRQVETLPAGYRQLRIRIKFDLPVSLSGWGIWSAKDTHDRERLLRNEEGDHEEQYSLVRGESGV